MDESLRAAIELALKNTPGDVALRAHLTGLLLEDGDADEAAAHAHTLLFYQPDHMQGLALAAAAADALGDANRAEAYRRVLQALESHAESPVLVGAQPNTEDELDHFLASLFDMPNERAKVTLDDVGGLEDVKARLHASFLGPLKNPEIREAYGSSLRGGMLLWGPPGCGKTFLARALAGELDAQFLSVALNDVLDMWLGNSEKNVHELFQQARRQAPCVLFFDEVDAIGMKRTEQAGSAGRGVITQLLNELDGVASQNEGLFVIGATNAPWDVDPALRRPGRFDRTILVLPPDETARLAILKQHCRNLPIEDVDLAGIASRAIQFSGADLAFVCKTAAENAMLRASTANEVLPVSQADFESALAESKPSTLSWFSVASNYAAFANRSGEYDDLRSYMKQNKLS